MRKLCPNFEKEDALDTVLEVPIPEEMFTSMAGSAGGSGSGGHKWQTMKTWIKPNDTDKTPSPLLAGRNAELQLLLNVVGSPLVPLPVQRDQAINQSVKDCSIEASTAKYIIHQYIAATGGPATLNSVNSMYAIGSVKMKASEFHAGDENVKEPIKNGSEVGGFVLWQKNPDLWYLELVVSGCKISAGSDGKVTWRQSTAQQPHASRGPPRPLRRALQGLDPRSTANLFSDAICIGEKMINSEDCFILKLEASPSTLKARSANSFEIIHHTIWGYFSSKTGLLMQFEDTHLLRMKGKGEESVFWETSMESLIEDYRYIDGINIAHRGKTLVTLYRYGTGSDNHKRKMEETWCIEEVDFNICGLTMECFLPPADLKKEQDGDQELG